MRCHGVVTVSELARSSPERWAVVEGPWVDEPSGSLWILRDRDGSLLTLDRTGWHVVALPDPPKGYFSRGDALAGFRGVSDASGFRLVGGFAWKRKTGNSGWAQESALPLPQYGGVEGIAFSGPDEVVIARLGICVIQLSCRQAAYWREANGWSQAIAIPMCCVKQVLGTTTDVVIESESGDRVRITRTEAVALPTPGPVEALARTSKGNILMSIAGAGIFTRNGQCFSTIRMMSFQESIGPIWLKRTELWHSRPRRCPLVR